jgi:rhomboid protease GluP
MNRPDDNRQDDDMNAALRRFEEEFGERRRADDALEDAGAPYRRGDAPQAGPGTPYLRGDAPQSGPGTPYGRVEHAQPQPVRLRIPLSVPRVVYLLLGINVVMYLATIALGAAGIGFNNALVLLGAKFGPLIEAGEYWRFITPIVLHGGLIHLAFNSYALYALGPEAERVYGSARFLAIYLLAGFAGTLASYIRTPGVSIGASGSIFGLIGTLAAFFYAARSLLGPEASRERVNQMIGLAVVNIVLGFAFPNIDQAAHIGGLLVGGLAGLALAPRFRIDDRVYPPVVVREDRPAFGWALAGVILLVLVGIAAVAVTVLGTQRATL